MTIIISNNTNFKKYPAYKNSGIEWIGLIPNDWDIAPIRALCYLGRGRVISNEEIANNSGDYPVYSSQTTENGIMGCLNTYDFDGEYVTWTTDGANAGTVFYRYGKFNCTNVCGTLKAKNGKVYLKYLPYVLNLGTKCYVRYDINPKLMNNEMAAIRMPLPEYSEQKVIADYLDRKTAQIDALIAKKERMIELLKEERTAIINQAVTRGLDPDVEMKDSGVEWLGKVPKHWYLEKLKYASRVNNSALPETTNESYEFCYIDISNVDLEDGFNIGEKISFGNAPSRARRVVQKGDTIVSTVRTYLKAIAYLEDEVKDIIVSTGFAVVRPQNKFIPKFLYYILRSEKFIDRVCALSVGVSYPAINSTELSDIVIWYPYNEEEQKRIVEYLDGILLKTKTAIKRLQAEREHMEEYRTALISEVVTGKIDARG